MGSRTVACPEKLGVGGGGGGGGAQSNFPKRDHQNIFNLILTNIYIYRISNELSFITNFIT